MTRPIIEVNNVSKRYRLGQFNAHTLREEAQQLFRRRRGNGRADGRSDSWTDETEFWALKDISFSVQPGELVGIIGRNGAGKSTLLKILSRITEPTNGEIWMRGRVASLLEVGTGFHPELTGRENIYLNGAILGMTRAEIRAKFDEIVDFAEIDKFLDTPVKRYSSGMYVRLAFAVAAHLEPEILIVDEVLAVGDHEFQKKCLGKMKSVSANSGRTVLFVSHNLSAVVDLTKQAILLHSGRVQMISTSREVVNAYLAGTEKEPLVLGNLSLYRRTLRTEGYIDIEDIKICDKEIGKSTIISSDPIVIDLRLRVHKAIENCVIVLQIINKYAGIVSTVMSSDDHCLLTLDKGQHTIRCDLATLPLSPGEYLLEVIATRPGRGDVWDVLEAVPGFRIATQHSGWLQWPERPGSIFFTHCKWTRR